MEAVSLLSKTTFSPGWRHHAASACSHPCAWLTPILRYHPPVRQPRRALPPPMPRRRIISFSSLVRSAAPGAHTAHFHVGLHARMRSTPHHHPPPRPVKNTTHYFACFDLVSLGAPKSRLHRGHPDRLPADRGRELRRGFLHDLCLEPRGRARAPLIASGSRRFARARHFRTRLLATMLLMHVLHLIAPHLFCHFRRCSN